MAKKGLSGQLNMFDFFRQMESDASVQGEVEMVSLIPDEEDEEADAFEPDNVEEDNVEEDIEEDIIIDDEVIDDNIMTDMHVYTKEEKNLDENVVMHKNIKDKEGVIIKSVSYIDYNIVRLVDNYTDEKVYKFENSKEAVDFYIEHMQNLRKS